MILQGAALKHAAEAAEPRWVGTALARRGRAARVGAGTHGPAVNVAGNDNGGGRIGRM